MGKKSGLKRRSPVLSGIYYPENPLTLTAKLRSYGLKKDAPACGGQVILAPHGAWDLCGNIAASAFASVQKGKKGQIVYKVLILGALHQDCEEGIYLSESDSFETPIGDLYVDHQLNHALASNSNLITISDIPHLSEHSLEVILPMVKYCFPNVLIVPILMSGGRPALISALAKALMAAMGKHLGDILIVLSSTVSQNLDPVLALSMAEEFRFLLERSDTKAFFNRLRDGGISACGGALVGAILESGLLNDRHLSALCPFVQGKGETGETIYYGAFSDGPN